MRRLSRWIAAGLGCLAIFTPALVFAARGSHASPKLLNLYLDWRVRDEDKAGLKKWDLVVFDMDLGWQFPDVIRELREENPKIKIIAYVAAGELAEARAQGESTSPGYILSQLIDENAYMHSSRGSRLSWWPGSSLMNATDMAPGDEHQRWNRVLPKFVAERLMSTGLWDGVFLDAAYGDVVSFFGNDIDPDGNGQANSAADVNTKWQAGMRRLIDNMRAVLGSDKIIMVNSSSAYASQVNGVLFENFPRYGWAGPFKEFQDALARNVRPAVTAFNTNTNNQETPHDYRLMRLGLASALLGDGYYSFDAGDRGHARTWWYDEYSVSLGVPKGPARRVAGGTGVSEGVWMREYEHGLVVVNSGGTQKRVDLGGVFEKIRGKQDAYTNNGEMVTRIDVPPHDGMILLGSSNTMDIRGAAFTNGEFIKAYKANGEQARNGFFAQRNDVASGVTVIRTLAPSGAEYLASAQNGKATVKSPRGTVSFWPFGRAYAGPVTLAIGNTNRDPELEIIVGRGRSKPSEVRVYSSGGRELKRWVAYNPFFAGGVRVAIGDLDGDGLREIVTGAGPGGGPHIRIFKTDGAVWGGSFFAFNERERGGVTVAVGDVDGDRKDEIIVGSGEGAIPRVRIFDFKGTLKSEITLGVQPVLKGLTVSAADLDGNGVKEILVGGMSVF